MLIRQNTYTLARYLSELAHPRRNLGEYQIALGLGRRVVHAHYDHRRPELVESAINLTFYLERKFEFLQQMYEPADHGPLRPEFEPGAAYLARTQEWLTGSSISFTVGARGALMKYSEQDPHLAAMWLPYEEAEELFDQGRLPETIAKCEQALRAGEELLGPDSKHLFLVLSLLAGAYYNANRPADSLALCLRQMAITRAVFGARHPAHGEVQRLTAKAYRALGRPADALPLDEQNLAIQVTTHGRTHPATVQAVVAMIDDYHGLGDQVELKRYLELAERLISTVAGVDDYSVRAITWHRTQLNSTAT